MLFMCRSLIVIAFAAARRKEWWIGAAHDEKKAKNFLNVFKARTGRSILIEAPNVTCHGLSWSPSKRVLWKVLECVTIGCIWIMCKNISKYIEIAKHTQKHVKPVVLSLFFMSFFFLLLFPFFLLISPFVGRIVIAFPFFWLDPGILKVFFVFCLMQVCTTHSAPSVKIAK